MGKTKYGGNRVELEDVRGTLLPLFKDDRHVLIGPVSMLLKCSINEAEVLLEKLRKEGGIRLLSPQEARTRGVVHGYIKNSPV